MGAVTRRHRLLMVVAVHALAIGVLSAPAAALEGETFAITEVDFVAGTIKITNHGEVDVDPNGLIVCQFPSYAPIDGAPALAPGESYALDLAGLGIPADAANGEIGLYLDNNFGSSDSIVAYVEWGSSDHERSPVAQGATVWDGNPVAGGAAALQSSASFPTGGADWSVVAAQGAEALPFTGISTVLVVGVAVALLLVGFGMLAADRRRTRSD